MVNNELSKGNEYQYLRCVLAPVKYWRPCMRNQGGILNRLTNYFGWIAGYDGLSNHIAFSILKGVRPFGG